MPKVRNDIYGKGDRSPKNFREPADLWRRLLYSACYLDGELCVSGDLEDSRGADEESEPSSILTHPTPGGWRCQPRPLLKADGYLIDGKSIIAILLRIQDDLRLIEAFVDKIISEPHSGCESRLAHSLHQIFWNWPDRLVSIAHHQETIP